VIWVFGLRAGSALGALEVGVLYAFISYIARVIEPLTRSPCSSRSCSRRWWARRACRRCWRKAETPLAQERPRARHGGAIRIDHLDFAYQPGRPVLHDLNLEIPPGSFLGIVGHTGSGKSTLLSLLLRFYPAPPGSIASTARRWSDRRRPLPRRVGLVPQDPSCWPRRRARTSRWAGR
jgi:ATP-binding cassette subfamily B multidrug efflux pump